MNARKILYNKNDELRAGWKIAKAAAINRQGDIRPFLRWAGYLGAGTILLIAASNQNTASAQQVISNKLGAMVNKEGLTNGNDIIWKDLKAMSGVTYRLSTKINITKEGSKFAPRISIMDGNGVVVSGADTIFKFKEGEKIYIKDKATGQYATYTYLGIETGQMYTQNGNGETVAWKAGNIGDIGRGDAPATAPAK